MAIQMAGQCGQRADLTAGRAPEGGADAPRYSMPSKVKGQRGQRKPGMPFP